MTEYTSMKYKTRGNLSPQGRPRVFFCCAAADFEQLFEPITEEILSIQTNAAIWYIEPKNGTMEGDAFLADLSQMQLIVVPVTTSFLRKDNPDPARTVAFTYAVEHHIPILPLMQESGLVTTFNEICGDIQYLDKTINDPTAIPYEKKIKHFLERVLVSDELAARVRDAFDAYIFLSYRKKDRAAAQKIMRLIHTNEFCRDVAIWYDEFLTPGENFNLAINEAMKKSALFALVVTPHLLENPNYVLTDEYPAARNMQIPILPFEAEQTEFEELARLYDGLRETVSTENTEEIQIELQELLTNVAMRETNDPVHNFLMGIAYLSGIDVEVDQERAVKLIIDAAKRELPEAIIKLVSMYENGEGVDRSLFNAIDWQKNLVLCLKRLSERAQSISNQVLLLDAWGDLGYLQKQCGFEQQAKETYFDLINYIYSLKVEEPEIINGKLSSCYKELSYVFDSLRDRFTAREWHKKAILIDEDLVRRIDSIDNKRKLAGDYLQMGYLYGWTESPEKMQALVWYKKAEKIIHRIIELNDDPKYQSDLGFCYIGIAQIYYRAGHFSDEETWKKKAVQVFLTIVNNGYSEYVSDLAFAYEQLGHANNRKAKNHSSYLKAISYYRTDLEKTGSIASYRGISICANSIVNNCNSLDDKDTKEQYLLVGIDALEKLVMLTQSPSDRILLARMYERCGGFYERNGQHENAVSLYQKNVSQLTIIARDLDNCDEKKKACLKILDFYMKQKQYEKALLWGYKGLEVLEHLIKGNEPKNLYYILRDRIKCYQKMGDICELIYGPALEWYLKSILLCEEMEKEFNDYTVYKLHYDGCVKAGNTERKNGEYKEAEKLYKKAYVLCKETLSRAQWKETRHDLSSICNKLGDVNYKLGRLSEALKWYRSFKDNTELLVQESDSLEALDLLCVSYYKLASKEWIGAPERKTLIEKMLKIGERLLKETGRARYQEFVDIAKHLLSDEL